VYLTPANDLGDTMTDLHITRRRVRDYWFVDGFQEIAGGASISLFSILMLLAIATASTALQDAALVILLVSAAAGAVFVRAAKQHVTYPRTGEVRERLQAKVARLVGIVLWVSVAIPLLATWEHSATFSGPMLVALTGLGAGASLAWAGHQRRTPRLYANALLCVGAALLAILFGLGTQMGVITVFLAAGVSSIASGAAGLVSYLGEHAPAREEATS